MGSKEAFNLNAREATRDTSLSENRWYNRNVLLLLRRKDNKVLLCQLETGRLSDTSSRRTLFITVASEIWAAASHLSGHAVRVSDKHSDVTRLCFQVTASEKDMKPLGRSHLWT